MLRTQSLSEQLVSNVLDQHKNDLNDISQEIWRRPEEAFEEKFAHDLLTDFLEKSGFHVTRHYAKLETAFRAEFPSAGYDRAIHPTIAVLCEYDALPDIGHACGHNLIAEAGIAAGLAIQEVLKRNSDVTDDQGKPVEGRIVVMGTPAEEGGGGKVILIQAGAFDDIDFAMMVHPKGHNDLEPDLLGMNHCHVKFHGKAAHASCGPWEGVNALDAAVAVYQSVSMYRQQMKPNWRMHGIIINGGAKANIIPDLTESHWVVRALTQVDLAFLKGKITDMFEAAAKATGCTMTVDWEPHPYSGMMHSSTMSQIYKRFAADNGVVYPEPVQRFNGSTDMGNVSLVVPSIHPTFFIGQPHMIHTRDFQRIAGLPEAQPYTLTVAKAMALTCVELFTKPEIREQARQEFAQKKKIFTG